nr:glycosyltransferase family 1 protein [Halobacillus litoralis]
MHVIPTTSYGGISSMVMNLYRKIDTKKVQFDFVTFNDGPLKEEIINRGGNVFEIPYIKNDGPYTHIKRVFNICKKNGPYEAIHVHHGYKSGFSLLSARMAGIKRRICHIHTSDVEQNWQKKYLYFLKTLSIINATKLVACGNEAGTFLFGKRSFELVTNAIDIEKYVKLSQSQAIKYKRTLQINSDLIIGHVGRFSDVKNHSFIIDVAESLCRRTNNFKIVLVGDGPLKPEIERKIKEKGLSDKFLLTGLRPDIPELMNMFNIFVFPSHFEGVPVSLLEAQVSDVPCVVSSGVSREVDIDNGSITFLNLTEGPNVWADYIIEKSKHPKNGKIKAAEALSAKGYSLNDNIAKLMEMYNVKY